MPKKNVGPTVPHILVGTASGQSMTSVSTCDLVIPQLPSNVPSTRHIIPGFQENLVGVGPLCDNNCTVKISKYAINIYSPTRNPIITDWSETDGSHL